MICGILDYSSEASVEQAILGDEATVDCFQCTDELDLPDTVSSLAAVMVWHLIKIGPATINRLTNCKAIVRVGVGYDNVDIGAAAEAGIPVVTIPDYGTNDVADHTLALMLALGRRLFTYYDAVRGDPVCAWRPELGGQIGRLTGRTLGIIGLGRIGSAVALRAKAFGFRVTFYDPYVADGIDKALQVERMSSPDALMEVSDFVTLHTPLTWQTRGMISDRLLAKARPGLILVNTARGGLVCLDAVWEALRSGQLQAFGADVLEPEPPDMAHPLIRAYSERDASVDGRVILTPHMAFYAAESRLEMRTKAAQRMRDAIRGVPLPNCVNFAKLRAARVPVRAVAPPPWDFQDCMTRAGIVANE